MTKDEALKLALEALKQIDEAMPFPVAKLAQKVIKEALAEPEPVAWGVDWGPDGNSVSIIKRLADGGIEVVGWEYAPHPPQRTWVGLTDEEIEKIAKPFWDGHLGYGYADFDSAGFARAIEAKLKENT